MYFHVGRCKVCDSPQRNKIEKELLQPNRKTYKQLKEMFDIGPKPLKKHLEQHMSRDHRRAVLARVRTKPQKYKPVEMETLIPSVKDTVGTLEFIQSELGKIYLDAEKKGKVGIQMESLKQFRKTQELVIRSQEIIIDATSQQGWQSLIPKILMAVDDYPDAKEAISIAMRQLRETKESERIEWVKD